MKVYGCVEVWLCVFMSLSLDGDEQSVFMPWLSLFPGVKQYLISVNFTSVYLIFLDFVSKNHAIKGHLQTCSSFKIEVLLDVQLCHWASSYH